MIHFLKPKFKVRDEFLAALTVGNVHGTATTPPGTTRTVVDTESKLTVTDGKLTFAGGKAAPAYGDPGLWHDALVSRVPGQVLAFKIDVSDVTTAIEVGLDADKTGELTVHRVRITADTVLYYDGTTAHPICFIPTDGRDYVFVIILRAAGALFFLKESEGEYLYLGETTTNTDSGYLGVSNYSAAATVDFIRPCNYRYLPAPELSDTFSGDAGTNDGRLSDGLGHAETTGLGAGGSGKAWSGSNAAIDGAGNLVITPTLGSELLTNPGLEAPYSSGLANGWTKSGTPTVSEEGVLVHGGSSAQKCECTLAGQGVYQYKPSAWKVGSVWAMHPLGDSGKVIRSVIDQADPGSYPLPADGVWYYTSRANRSNKGIYVFQSGDTAATFYTDDASVKGLNMSTCFSTHEFNTKDIDITVNFKMVTFLPCGIVLGLNDAGTSFILAYHNGAGNVVLEICEAGTYTSKASVAAVYSADAPLRVRRDDREIWVWYNGVLIGTGPTTTLSGLEDANLSGTKAGLFSTSELNSFAGVSIRYIGTSGEYSILKRIIGSPYNDAPARVGECMPMGTWGAGMGIAPALPPDTTPLEGTFDRTNPNFANYIHTPTSSILGYSPKGYYRIGHVDNITYPVYGVNSVEIRNVYDFVDTAAANAAGFALHRAFIDGGGEIPGFFSFKYQASNNGGVAASIRNGLPISTHADHNPIAGLTGISANQYYSAIDAAKLIGTGFHCQSIFQYDWLRMVALAHAQAVTTAERCGWYNPTKNYPKGCNNNALKDTDDTTVIYASDGYSNCGKTGSGVPFSKTTHNGQECGIADINGNMWEIAIGMTCIATSKSVAGVALENPCRITINSHAIPDGSLVQLRSLGGSTQLNDKIYTITVVDANNLTLNGVDATSGIDAWTSGGTATYGNWYTAKQATSMASFTSGATMATDHWGATGVAAMMNLLPQPPFRTTYPNNGFTQRWGSGANQVLDEAVSGDQWLLKACMMPKSSAGIDTTGTDLYGKDYFYQYIRDQLCVIVGGHWSDATLVGVGAVYWYYDLAYSYGRVGFRAAYSLPAS